MNEHPILRMEQEIEKLHSTVVFWQAMTALCGFGLLVVGAVSGIVVKAFSC